MKLGHRWQSGPNAESTTPRDVVRGKLWVRTPQLNRRLDYLQAVSRKKDARTRIDYNGRSYALFGTLCLAGSLAVSKLLAGEKVGLLTTGQVLSEVGVAAHGNQSRITTQRKAKETYAAAIKSRRAGPTS